MSEPRNITLLYEAIEKDYTWRITELSNFKSTVITEQNKKAQIALIRAGVALLYAHWEGFVKIVADLYYEYVSYQDCTLEELNNCFSSIVVKGELERLKVSKKLKEHHILIGKILHQRSEKANFSGKSPIKTANLRYDIFEDVCILIGLDINDFETRCRAKRLDRNIEKTINESLVDRRNSVAHGERLLISVNDYKLLYDAVVNHFLDIFKEMVMDAAQRKKYLR